MATRGTLAKQVLINKIIGALSEEYVGTADNKYYFAIPENGQKVQVCISMTCPKVELSADGTKKDPKNDKGIDFDKFLADAPPKPIVNTKARVEPQEEEMENKRKLLSALGF